MHSQCQLGRRRQNKRLPRGEMAARRGRPDSYYESMASRRWDNACRKRAERYADARNATHVRKAIPLIQPSDPRVIAQLIIPRLKIGGRRHNSGQCYWQQRPIFSMRSDKIAILFFVFFVSFCGYSSLYVFVSGGAEPIADTSPG